MKLTDDQKLDLLQRMSMEFLTEPFPDNWNEMSEAEQLKFIDEWAWEVYEDMCPEYVLARITDSYDVAVEYINNKL